jgi:drug/metabolite transporter (DMT)-like permease
MFFGFSRGMQTADSGIRWRMQLDLVLIMLGAALLHAAWNAIIKGGGNALFEAVLKTLGGGVAVCCVLPFLPLPAPQSMPYLAASCAIHLAYYSLLGLSYRNADMSTVYPIMRGTAPLLTSLTLVLVLGVPLSAAGWLGVALLSTGILTLAADALRQGRPAWRGCRMALVTALVIMCYTLADGYGGRASMHPVSYTCWLFFINAFPMSLILYWRCRSEFTAYVRQRWRFGLLGGVCSLGSYGIAIWAMTQAPIAMVAALRESSVIFGMLLAVFFLGERVTLFRVLAVLLVPAGMISLYAPA